MADAGTSQAVDFRAKEKAVLAYLLTIPEVSRAVSQQRAGRSQDAKASMRAAIAQLPPEVLARAAPGTAPAAAPAPLAGAGCEAAAAASQAGAGG
ncbi:unnamed protein product [Prorocentrum cordatum]|uniref:Uncharacterized protein n=1 Tax=Prorocentrum cordatum TaxID=2364126 RepID=A0ABN9U8E1_9DINO|nr:unnamed protein product [Polarella glacialis]